MKKRVRLTESRFKQLVVETAKKMINELDYKTYASAAQKCFDMGDEERGNKFLDYARQVANAKYGRPYVNHRPEFSDDPSDDEELRYGLSASDYSLDDSGKVVRRKVVFPTVRHYANIEAGYTTNNNGAGTHWAHYYPKPWGRGVGGSSFDGRYHHPRTTAWDDLCYYEDNGQPHYDVSDEYHENPIYGEDEYWKHYLHNNLGATNFARHEGGLGGYDMYKKWRRAKEEADNFANNNYEFKDGKWRLKFGEKPLYGNDND